ncbi:MAG: DnaJ domain-containing protein [Planctomycetota bacterium]|jgi:tetratricopeptide (TPR) repeat protein|nr:DnaJ domain-containing protein [Planctomycetota bacterium]MDP7130175.1 DnaJ domain-containing protein [Planctomycetota bacterium]MDP7252931.1 DnaJ domain-containing protein [Planctomycetota bacterium]
MNVLQVDYYRILEIQWTATADEIRRSYRRLAKKYHPDLHPAKQEWAQSQFRVVSEAYNTLSDPRMRDEYDVRYRLFVRPRSRNRAPNWPWPDELTKIGKAILDQLVQKNNPEGIRLYEALKSKSELVDPLARLNTRDYLDCKFLLGEAYESVGDLAKAIDFYEAVYEEECEEPRARCYFEVIIERLGESYLKCLSKAHDLDSARENYYKALQLETTNGGRAQLHKKMAEVLVKFGDVESAVDFLRQAFEANPKLKGVKKLYEKLSVNGDS